MRFGGWLISACLILLAVTRAQAAEVPEAPLFSRHVAAVLSKLGCNGGGCHGAVQGKNGFRLSLFAARPEFDFAQIARDEASRRISPLAPQQSLLLQKPVGAVPHAGGKVLARETPEYEVLRRWLEAGAVLDDVAASRVTKLEVSPSAHVVRVGADYPLKVQATFADGTTEDVTCLCSFTSMESTSASVSGAGIVRPLLVGDVAIIVRYRDEAAIAHALITRQEVVPLPKAEPHNFIDEQVLAKLRQLNIPSAELADDVTFLRRARLDVTGELPTPEEVREFLADGSLDKRAKKIQQLLDEPGYAALWALKFSDLLKASDFGVYADGLAEHYEAPRFYAWVRARLTENMPYDEFAANILLATSREGRSLEAWAEEVIALQTGYQTPREDLDLYAKRKTLDIYWQRKDAIGVPGAMQVAHAFLGLRLECAQCHRHPHDVWQQDDLLSFANFFTRVRKVGFQGDNEKRYPEAAKLFKEYEQEGKRLAEEAKKLKEGPVKELAEKAKAAQREVDRLNNEIRQAEQQLAKLVEQDAKRNEQQATIDAKRAELAPQEKIVAEHKQAERDANQMERRGKLLGDEIAKRVLHAEVLHLTDEQATKQFASVSSPLGSQESKTFRLLGENKNIELAPDEDPRKHVVEWLRRPDNPFFAKAIVNRVWAHYFGRGIIDPPDDLSAFNPPTHPELLDKLCQGFIEHKYDLKWLHMQILSSRTYQQSSVASSENETDRANYAYFYFRRLPAEVLLDAVHQATGTREDFDMQYYHWPKELKTVEMPYMSRNGFVTFMLEQFGRPERNTAAQCDCERISEASLLQVLSFANHPRISQKIADPQGRVAKVIAEHEQTEDRIEALYLSTLSRLPEEHERQACEAFVAAAESSQLGLQGVLWSLLNTKEFVLQH